MANAVEVTIDVIVHATEEISKFVDAFGDIFGLPEDVFTTVSTTGHYDNPITILSAKLTKKSALNFVEILLEELSAPQKDAMIKEIAERTSGSKFHLRLGKQEFLNGILSFKDEDAIKLKIYTPIYNKKDTIRTFTKLFSGSPLD